MIRSTLVFLILFSLLTAAELLGSGCDPAKTGTVFEITVSSGSIDRFGTVVQISLPAAVAPGNYVLEGPDGHKSVLQVDQANTGWLILDHLPAGSDIRFRFDTSTYRDEIDDGNGSAGYESGAMVIMHENTLDLFSGGRHVISFFHGVNNPPEELDARYRRGGYIHPVKTPAGTVLSSHLDPDRLPHHSGIWSAWTNTSYQGRTPDFWNVDQGTGRVDIEELVGTWSGGVHAGFESVNRFTDLSSGEPVTVLLENWKVRVYYVPGNPGYHMFDLEITQSIQGSDPLTLPEYRYGGIGFRGHADWADHPETTRFLTSEGLGRDGHGTRTRWCHVGGYSDGELGGVAILGHPSNYRFPQTVRIHPEEPFFNYAPTQLGDMEIRPGSPYTSRLRFITYDGDPDADIIERLWADYAMPPVVHIEEVD
ncbi:MAG: PmoA family protein [Rhodothermaceae bacterium]|nr:PmoA family protein [Rhodothermaceae bacterium]